MLKLALISTHPGTGKTTIAVNLAAALARNGKRCLLVETDPGSPIFPWLSLNPPGVGDHKYAISTHIEGVEIYGPASPEEIRDKLEVFNQFDYTFLEAHSAADINLMARFADHCIAVTDLGGENEVRLLMDLDQQVKAASKKNSISLIVLTKIVPGEWEQSSAALFALAEYFEPEKIADPIPRCQAIADLPLTGLTVWDLPDEYRNRKDAFARLLKSLQTL